MYIYIYIYIYIYAPAVITCNILCYILVRETTLRFWVSPSGQRSLLVKDDFVLMQVSHFAQQCIW